MADDQGRSDESVQDDVAARLRDALGAEAEQVQVHVVGGEATLAGSVGGAETRTRAEEVVQAIDGVTYVINNLRVAQEGTTGATG